MNKEELIKKLKDIADRQDVDLLKGSFDDDHMQADCLLLEYIDDKEVTQTFENIEKWYA
jgi:hypothetical protein